jgi:hypothetical protein
MHRFLGLLERIDLGQGDSVGACVDTEQALDRLLTPAHLRRDGALREPELVEQMDAQVLRCQVEVVLKPGACADLRPVRREARLREPLPCFERKTSSAPSTGGRSRLGSRSWASLAAGGSAIFFGLPFFGKSITPW